MLTVCIYGLGATYSKYLAFQHLSWMRFFQQNKKKW